MKVTDPERRETVIVEHEVYEPGFYIAEKIGEAIMPSTHETLFATREDALLARALWADDE